MRKGTVVKINHRRVLSSRSLLLAGPLWRGMHRPIAAAARVEEEMDHLVRGRSAVAIRKLDCVARREKATDRAAGLRGVIVASRERYRAQTIGLPIARANDRR